MEAKKQALTSLDIKIILLKKRKQKIDLLPLLRNKYPHLKIQQPHISMALDDKYPTMLKRIREVIDEI